MRERALRIFAVEDEALLLMKLEAVLKATGHDVVATAMSGKEAMATAAFVEADVALVDLHLADGLTGLAVGRHLVQVARIPVVYLTASERCIPAFGIGRTSGCFPSFGANDVGGDYGHAVGIIAKPYTVSGIGRALTYLADALLSRAPLGSRPTNLFITPAYAARWAISA